MLSLRADFLFFLDVLQWPSTSLSVIFDLLFLRNYETDALRRSEVHRLFPTSGKISPLALTKWKTGLNGSDTHEAGLFEPK